MLAVALTEALARRQSLPILDPGQGIRATVIGASQFTVQVSGKTICLPDAAVLPLRNVPVVHLGLDLAAEIDEAAIIAAIRGTLDHMGLKATARMAISFTFSGDPEFSRLEALGKALLAVVAPGGERKEPLLLMIDGDIGKTLGHIISEELPFSGPFLSIDGVQLQELDFVDIGELISPPGVVPVIIKSLLFS
jgi:ethanolamine utilization protein EutA